MAIGNTTDIHTHTGSYTRMDKKQAIENWITKLRREMAMQDMKIATEKSYAGWARRYMNWLLLNPNGTSEQKVKRYLSMLATERNVSISTQKQALNAIVWLYRHVFDRTLGDIGIFSQAHQRKRLPTVLSPDEAQALLRHMAGDHWLIASTLYGSGLRLAEALSLRTQDIDFSRKQIMVRNGKGGKDRAVMLPLPLVEPLKQKIESARRTHRRDLANGFGSVYLPHALERKFGRSATDFKWQYVFQASKIGACPRTGEMRRHHLHPTATPKAIRDAARAAQITKRVSAHTLRHSFATHILERGVDIKVVQELLGHADVRTTMIYNHVLENRATSVPSPLEMPRNVIPMVAMA